MVSLVEGAWPGRDSGPAWERAWRHFSEVWSPRLRCRARSLIRRLGRVAGVGDADDLVQGFLLRSFEKQWLGSPGIRDFEAYLMSSFYKFVIGEYRRAGAQRRAPRTPIADLSKVAAPCRASGPPQVLFEQRPIEEGIRRARAALRTANGRYALVIAELALGRMSSVERDALAHALGVERRNLSVYVFRAREAFGRELWRHLRDVAGSEAAFSELWSRVERFVCPRHKRN